MKYNILTVANENYKDFLKLFVNSLFENIDFNNLEKVLVYDTGLSIETINYISVFPKIELVQTGMSIESKEIHDEGWAKNTYSKTVFLKEVLEKYKTPTFMIDSDCIFLQNFENLIDFSKDLVACDRNREGFSKHIGSFFGALNVNNSIEFLDKWILNIKKLQKQGNLKHCESPALSITLKENNYDFQEVQEMIVSAVFPDETSRIIHLKSDYYAKTVSERLSLPHATQFTKRYL
jgi:hypothetical protein